MRNTLFCITLCAIALPAVAAWTVTTDGAPSGCTHVISDGNWKIGVYRNSDDNWTLGKRSGQNGSGYVAGSGDLDLTGVAADCGVIIKASNNGALERIAGLTSIIFPDSLETMYGNTVAGCASLTNVVVGSGIRSIGQQCFYNCTSLVGGNGTGYSSSQTSYAYFCIDAAGSPGYLTVAS